MAERQTTVFGKEMNHPMVCLRDECPEMQEVFPEGGDRRDRVLQVVAGIACDEGVACLLMALRDEDNEGESNHAS